ncbi:MAG: right-handed parallel beta-helix repeat-containing protein [Candidatus Bathyarchaeota archaeon]|nr:right-handed parallel beta-helix repeat-containing protein [Candidatus Bathyarchaeota archaeon]
MKNKALALLTTIALLVSLAAVLDIERAAANFMPLNIPPHNIEIMANGTVTGTDNITRVGSSYEFTANVSGSILVSCDNITINGNGYSLTGNGGSTGIFMEGRQNVTVKNLTISNFERGIEYSYYREMFSDSKNNALLSNNILNCQWGIYCYLSINITISRNNISNCSKRGISVFLSSQIFIYGNNLSENNVAIGFAASNDNYVYANNFFNNTAHAQMNYDYDPSATNWHYKQWGNYWSNYTGSDTNKDGVGDTPHVIDWNNTDYYPLISPIDTSAHIPTPENSVSHGLPFEGLILIAVSTIAVLIILPSAFLLHRRRRNTTKKEANEEATTPS